MSISQTSFIEIMNRVSKEASLYDQGGSEQKKRTIVLKHMISEIDRALKTNDGGLAKSLTEVCLSMVNDLVRDLK